MICNSCGKDAVSEQSKFCIYCGESFHGDVARRNSNQVVHNVEESNMNDIKEVPFSNWVGTLLIPFIPIVGGIIYLVMLIIWSVSKEVNPTKKNWARANLLYAAISVVIGIILGLFLVGFFIAIFEGIYY